MTRKEEREQASVEYQMSKRPMALGGDAFADMVYKININPSFIAGAEWADEHPREGLISINKVVDWLRDNFHSYEIADTGYGHIESLNFMDMGMMIEDFLETMKK